MPTDRALSWTAMLVAGWLVAWGCAPVMHQEPAEVAEAQDVDEATDQEVGNDSGGAAEGPGPGAGESSESPPRNGACTDWSESTISVSGVKSEGGKDIPGLSVYGTGTIGEGALRIVAEPGISLVLEAGTFFEPKVFASIPPQPLMLAHDVPIQGPGTFLATAHCMKHHRPVPSPETEFYSSPKAPSNKVQYCQSGCGDDQTCIWDCEKLFTVISFQIVDDCDDGFPLVYRFFNRTQCLVWPHPGATFATGGLGVVSTHDLDCEVGTVLCFGGHTEGGGGVELGLGIGGNLECPDCCTVCGDTAGVSGWTLSCD